MLVEDLIFEDKLSFPILQIELGKFISNAPELLGIAILHPRRLVAYEFVAKGKVRVFDLCVD